MQFEYRDYFGVETEQATKRSLDAMIGDSSLFKRADMIEAGWALIQPVLEAWGGEMGGELYHYAAGSDGPASADALIGVHRHWRPLSV